MKKKFLSRKFIMSLVILGITLIYFSLGKISEDGFLHTLMTIYGLYVGGNVTTKFLKKE